MSYYHEEHFTIRHYEVGVDKRLRYDTFAYFMEEAAEKHANQLGFGLHDLAHDNLSWVMTKMRIVFFTRPHAGESLTVRTWPCNLEKSIFRREFIFYGINPSAPTAKATTQWVLFDIKKRCLVHPNADKFSPEVFHNTHFALHDGQIKIPPTKNGYLGSSFTIRLDDIDQNVHVNNTRYINFVLEAAQYYTNNELSSLLPVTYNYLGNKQLMQLDIAFRSEAYLGETVYTETAIEQKNKPSLLHSIKRGKSELVRARTIWLQ